jgi:hypothetical protein
MDSGAVKAFCGGLPMQAKPRAHHQLIHPIAQMGKT